MKNIFKPALFILLICGEFGAGKDEVKSVSVMEGDSVTLNPDQIQGFNQIQWKFGDTDPVIAKTDGTKPTYPNNMIFSKRLELNQTGSLTIKNMKTKHSGLYELEISLENDTPTVKFSVTVYESPSVTDPGKGEMINKSVIEGETVTLKTNVTDGDELIVWRFGDEGKLIAKHDTEAKSSPSYPYGKFRDRLKLDQSGSLTITNASIADSGYYKVKISSNKQTLHKRFTVTVTHKTNWFWFVFGGAAAAGVFAVGAFFLFKIKKEHQQEKEIDSIKPKTDKLMEGDFAFLSSGVTEVEEGDQMLWTFEDEKSPIATMRKNDKKTYYYDDKRFRGRLQLDPQTGSLIIRNLRKSDFGLYLLKIKSKGGASYRKYEVKLRGEVTTMQVEEKAKVTLTFDHFDLQSVSRINWFRDERCIASLATKNKKISKPDDLGGRFKDKLELDSTTGFLTIKNIRPEHTGVYNVRSNQFANSLRTFNIICDDSSETWSNESETAGLMSRIQRCLRRAGEKRQTDEMKMVPIEEGQTLNLNTETQIQKDDEIILMFGTCFATGHPYDIIARISKQDNDEFISVKSIFKDRLKLDHSKSLTITITDLQTVHYGDYYLQITNKKKKSFKSFTFIVVPKGVVGESMSVTKGNPVTLNPDLEEIQRDDLIIWSFQAHGMIIANIKEKQPKDDFDTRFCDRLKLNLQTGSLTIRQTRTTDSGVYETHIICGKRIRNRRFNVTIQDTDSPQNTEDDTPARSIADFYESKTLLDKQADGVDDQEATSPV